MKAERLVGAMDKRHSVRTYTKEEPSKEIISKVGAYMEELNNEYKEALRIALINTEHAGRLGTYGVIKGASYYLAVACKQGEYDKVTLGYAVEKLVLYCTSLGLGTVWVGGTYNKSNFAKAMNLKEDEQIVIIVPIGYEAEKKALIAKLMGDNSGKRKAFGEVFFDKNAETPLSEQAAGNYAEALNNLRIAPSAVNKQPWRVIKDGKSLHFYATDLEGYHKVDLGIALAHFHLTLQAQGIEGGFKRLRGPIKTPFAYLASWIEK